MKTRHSNNGMMIAALAMAVGPISSTNAQEADNSAAIKNTQQKITAVQAVENDNITPLKSLNAAELSQVAPSNAYPLIPSSTPLFSSAMSIKETTRLILITTPGLIFGPRGNPGHNNRGDIGGFLKLFGERLIKQNEILNFLFKKKIDFKVRFPDYDGNTATAAGHLIANIRTTADSSTGQDDLFTTLTLLSEMQAAGDDLHNVAGSSTDRKSALVYFAESRVKFGIPAFPHQKRDVESIIANKDFKWTPAEISKARMIISGRSAQLKTGIQPAA